MFILLDPEFASFKFFFFPKHLQLYLQVVSSEISVLLFFYLFLPTHSLLTSCDCSCHFSSFLSRLISYPDFVFLSQFLRETLFFLIFFLNRLLWLLHKSACLVQWCCQLEYLVIFCFILTVSTFLLFLSWFLKVGNIFFFSVMIILLILKVLFLI